MTDPTTVRITVNRRDERKFLDRLGCAPHRRKEHSDKVLVDLHFSEWSHPACHEFHFDGIPFTGLHREGECYEPHRMCGDGDSSMEIYCDREAHLYVVVDEQTGLPNSYSAAAVSEFLAFERTCKQRLGSRNADAIR